MTRPIRFRAWDLSDHNPSMKKVASIEYYHKDLNPFACEENLAHVYDDESGLIISHSVPFSKLILMQFTGLHDKNGKEIWEGDIVLLNGAFKTSIISAPGQFTFSEPQADNRLSCWSRIEVLGNIYENQELIKETK